MRCPFCGNVDSKVIDSRPINEFTSIRRRRECPACNKRFTTFEMVESVQIIVTKKDGSKELFDKNKLMSGLLKACQKRPVTDEQINNLVESIECEFKASMRVEVSTLEIGEKIMAGLRELDEVAYIRFASVYREFPDAEAFMDELNSLKLLKEEKAKKAQKNI